MDRTSISRRDLLRSAVLSAGMAELAMWGSDAKTATGERCDASGEVLGDSVVPSSNTYRTICPQHKDLMMQRSSNAHDEIKKSLSREGARPVVVGAYQMANHCGGKKQKEENLERMLAAIQRMAGEGVQVLVFPEMCLPGYFTYVNGSATEARKANRALADEVKGSRYLDAVQRAARQEHMVVSFGFCERDGHDYYNSIGVVDADGSWLGTRRKNPLYPWAYEVDSFTEPDASERSAVFGTKYAKVGISNCFDGAFPESIRQMRLDGAEMLLWSNAAVGSAYLGSSGLIHHAGSYAQANNMWVVCCNCVAANTSGTSVIMGPAGEPLVILPPDREGFGVATVNLALTVNWEMWRKRLGPQWKAYL